MKLFYRELGEGKPVVMLHGVFGASDNLLSQGKALAEKYKVFLLDQRNHGQSPHSSEFSYSAMAEDLKEFLEDHHIVQPVIIGHSMGGKTVMSFGEKYQDMAEKFVVVDIAPRFYSRHHDEILKGLNSIKINEIRGRQEADKQLSLFVPELGVRQFLLKNLERTGDGFEWKINLPVITEKIENVGEELNSSAVIKKPTLFLRGENSNYIQEKDEERIRRQFPNSEMKTVEGAGHWLHAEKPKEFVSLLMDFIG